jgi:acyl-coenzyme A synthetase/AMP-(fatty) acid ligase
MLDAEGPEGSSAADVTNPDSRRLVACGSRERVELHGPEPLIYVTTSGTTGKSKIAAFTQDSLRGNARNALSRLGLRASDRVIVPVPLAHMYGLGAAFLPAMLAGSSVRLVPDANLLRYLEAEAEFDPQVAYLTPGFAHLLLKGRKQPRPYRLTVLAGDRAGEATFTDYEKRHGCTVNLYGSTELGVIAAGDPQDSFEARRDCAGAPLQGVEFSAPERDNTAADQAYPLRVRHPYGTCGYADDSGRPSIPEKLASDGWYHTQDLGWFDERGRVRLVGRQDHCVKRDGMLVAFADVEKALLRIPGIEHAVVVGGGMTVRGKELVAFCAGGSSLERDTGSLARSARSQLASHAVPDRFVIVDELPLTDTGKPDRLRLAAMSSGSSANP